MLTKSGMLCLVVSAVLAICAFGEKVVIDDTPAYTGYHGCAPTSGMEIVGYWDNYGYPNLIDGSSDWSTNEAEIKEAIASKGDGDGTISNAGTPGTGHVPDYAFYDGVNDFGYFFPYPDLSDLGPNRAHSDNCLADFMETSKSAIGQKYGTTSWLCIGQGEVSYMSWRDPSYIFESFRHIPWPSWEAFVHEINFGRPVTVIGDWGDGDHSETAVGYDTTGFYARGYWYSGTPHQYDDWNRVHQMDTFRPTGTWDSAWKVTDGYWTDAASWDNGLPSSQTFTYIPEGSVARVENWAFTRFLHNVGSVRLEGGSLFAGQHRSPGQISGYGVVEASLKNYGCITGDGGSLRIVRDISGDGDLIVMSGADLELFCNGTIDGNLQDDGGVSISNGYHITTKGTITGTGDISLFDSATFDVEGNVSLEGVSVSDSATFNVGGNASLGAGFVSISDSATFNVEGDEDSVSRFGQSGGIHAIRGNLYFSTDIFEGYLVGGVLSCDEEYMGGIGNFMQSGGVHNMTNLYMGVLTSSGNSSVFYFLVGGDICVKDRASIGCESRSTVIMHVRGYGSRLTTTNSLTVGEYGFGYLNITSGGEVSSSYGYIGQNAGSAGAVNIHGVGSVWNSGSVSVGGYGTGSLLITGGGRIAANCSILSGSLRGDGFIDGDVLNGEAIIGPGSSQGILNINGSYEQQSTGTLQIEVGGLAVGSEYDKLIVSNVLSLDGVLDVLLVNGFSPQLGDRFDIMDFTGWKLTGRFTTVRLPALSLGLAWDTQYLYTTGEIRVVEESGLSLLRPNGAEILMGGTYYTIGWQSKETIRDVYIDYSADNGHTWVAVEPQNTGNSCTYNWLVPKVTSVECLVRISDASNSSVSDTSGAVFTIYECQLSGELSGDDCYIDARDLATFVGQWLESDDPVACPFSADLTGEDCEVNLADFAVLGDQWLQCGNPYQTGCLPSP